MSAQASFGRTLKAVAWSFLGLRRRDDYEQDVQSLSPLRVIAVGLVAVALFVGALIAFVHWVVAA
jgi:hypothetical protein